MTCIVKAKRQCNNTAWGQKATLYLVLRGEGRYGSIEHPPFLPQPPEEREEDVGEVVSLRRQGLLQG